MLGVLEGQVVQEHLEVLGNYCRSFRTSEREQDTPLHKEREKDILSHTKEREGRYHLEKSKKKGKKQEKHFVNSQLLIRGQGEIQKRACPDKKRSRQ
jgi:hypothetical protein